MFKAPFSFNGRIRRLEYGISFIIYFAIVNIPELFFDINNLSGFEAIVTLVFIAVSVYILLAQGTKRCHDIGKNGWYQLIPLYGFYLIFAEGHFGENDYGPNPKGIGNEASNDALIESIGK